MPNENDLFQTTDLSLATTLSLSYPLRKVDRSNPPKAQFTFIGSPELREFVDNYWLGKLKVEPQMYFNALRIIKTRLYESKN